MPAAVIAGGAILGGVISSNGAKSAANAQAQSSDAAVAEQRRQFDTLLSLTAPQRAIGNQALGALGSVYGYSPTTDPYAPATTGNALIPQYAQPSQDYNGLLGYIINNNPELLPQITGQMQIPENATTQPSAAPKPISPADYTNFFASPDYQFRLQQGTQAVQNSAAAQGGLYSGNALRALSDYGQGTAAGEFGNWFNRQAALAGIGQTATTQAGNAALATGQNVGNLLVNQGNARASGIIGQTNSMTNLVNQLATLWGSGGFSGGLPGSTAPWAMSGVPA